MEQARKILLVGWECADWDVAQPLMEAGALPTLHSLANRGVMGNVESTAPLVSASLWTSIATGKRADRHGVLTAREPDPVAGGVRPVSGASREAATIGEMFAARGRTAIDIHWPGSSDGYAKAPAALGEDWPVPPGFAPEWRDLLVHPGEIGADALLPFVPQAGEIDQAADARLVSIAAAIAEAATAHAMATFRMAHEEWDLCSIRYAAIGQLARQFAGFAAPQLTQVGDRDFALYSGVVDGGYRLLDMMLASLLELAGPDALVLLVSDHGFLSGDRRQTDMAPERSQGMLCLAGPGIVEDELVHGASILDVTPTLLALSGLPIGDDMDGRALLTAFVDPSPPSRIPTWESLVNRKQEGAGGELEAPVQEAHEAIEALVALGYRDEPSEGQRQDVATCERDRKAALADAYLVTYRYRQGAELFEQLRAERIGHWPTTLGLARCRVALGQVEMCEPLIDELEAALGDHMAVDWLRGYVAIESGDTDLALQWLERAEESPRQVPERPFFVGNLYLKMQRWGDATRAFQSAIQIDPDYAPAHAGLAQVHLLQGDLEEAADHALSTVRLQHLYSRGHHILGEALARMGRLDPAIQAFQTCLRLEPASATAHHWLSDIYRHRRHRGDGERAARHLKSATQLREASA